MKKKLKNATLLFTVAVGIFAIANKVIDIVTNLRDKLPAENGKFFAWKYGNIFYIKKGKGKPVLLIHDMNPSSSAYEWHKVINHMSRTNTVYAVDLLGCGRSDKPNLTYTNYMYVQLVNDFIKEVITKKTDVIATGASLSFVIMACQLEKDSFKKIIGVSPSDLSELTKFPGKRHNMLKYLIETPIIGTMIYNIEMSKNSILNNMLEKNYFKEYLVSKEVLNAYHQAAHLQNSKGKYLLASIRCHYTSINMIPALRNINNSICLIGGKENIYMNEIMDEYVDQNPAIETAYISDSKYLPQLESPAKFTHLLNIVLSSQE